MMRIKSLDSLRGIAALTVVISHLIITPTLSGTGLVIGREAHVLAKDAVLIFFVLSGFVLFLSLNDRAGFNYLAYAVKRVARIYFPFVAAILLSAALMIMTAPQPIAPLSRWFNHESWYVPVSGLLVGCHLLMTDIPPWQSLDNVMWSLVHELRISAIFPLLAFGIRARWKTTVAICLLISAASLAIHSKWGDLGPVDPVATLRYLIFFAVGAAMALHLERLRASFARQSGLLRLGAWALTLALLASPFGALENVTTAGGAIALVLLCFADRRTDWHLSKPLPLWLGQISYSLYLIHLPIVLALTHLLYGRLPLVAILLLALACSMGAAALFYRFVETGAIWSGRQLAAVVKARTPASGTALS